MKGDPTELAVWCLAVSNLRVNAVKDVLPLTSCSNLRQGGPRVQMQDLRP